MTKVGGQALADGVFMRTGRAWAVARADGSVEVGRLPATWFGNVPVLRVLAGLGPGLVMGFRALAGAGRRSGGTANGPGRRLVVTLLAITAVGFVAPGVVGRGFAGQLALTAASLLVLRLVAPASLWRYHGAEHKAVAAYEAGVDLDDPAATATASRVHRRCGTNLVFLLAFAATLLDRVPAAAQLPALVLLLGAVAEVLGVAARYPDAAWSRLLLTGGGFLQRHVTTAEPTADELRTGVVALRACLAEHERLEALDALDSPVVPVVEPVLSPVAG